MRKFRKESLNILRDCHDLMYYRLRATSIAAQQLIRRATK
jgi:hypothetical protein